MTLNYCSLRLACLMGMIVMSVGCSKEGKGDGPGTGKVPVVPVVSAEMVEVEGGKWWVDSNGNPSITTEDREGKVSEQKYEEKRIGKFWVGKCEVTWGQWNEVREWGCLLYTSPSPRDRQKSRMPSSA